MNDKPKKGAHLAKYKWPTGRNGNPTGRPVNPFSMRQLLRNEANGPLPESFHKRAAQMLGIKPDDLQVRRMTYKEFIAKNLPGWGFNVWNFEEPNTELFQLVNNVPRIPLPSA